MRALDPTTIGLRIREVRGAATQQEFANQLGVGRVSVARYETGERTPDAEFVSRLNTICGVDPMWLLLGRTGGTAVAPAAPAPSDTPPPLTAEEAELLANYRNAGAADRRAIQRVSRHMARHPAMETFDPEVMRARALQAADPRPFERAEVITRRRRPPEPKKANSK